MRISKWLGLLVLVPAILQAAVSLPQSEMLTVADAGTGVNFQVAVQLPPDYYQPEAFKVRYPVVYQLGAITDFALVVGASYDAMQSGSVKPAIVVALSREHQYQQLSAPKTATERSHYGEQLAEYRRFLTRQLIPLIDAATGPQRRTEASLAEMAGRCWDCICSPVSPACLLMCYSAARPSGMTIISV